MQGPRGDEGRIVQIVHTRAKQSVYQPHIVSLYALK